MTPDEFVIGRSGQWLSLGRFFRLEVPERRAEFIFGTAAEVMQMMSDLPSKVTMFGHGKIEEGTSAAPEGDAMAAAIHAAKKQGGAAPAAGSK